MGNDRKRLYDEAASTIMDPYLHRSLEPEEMQFLLHLLDVVIMKPDQRSLPALLKKWRSQPDSPDVDEIVKATLLATDFNDSEQLAANLALLEELIQFDSK